MIRKGEWDAALGELYYAAHFAARAALADLQSHSKKHSTWNGEFNRRHGKGQSWIPARYPAALNQLQQLREDFDYKGAGPNDKTLTKSYEGRVRLLLRLVRKNTPLLYYPEFLEHIAAPHYKPNALEFDYYCPRSYFHKERAQFQVSANPFLARHVRLTTRAARDSMRTLNATRQADYVLGWNSRLGQDADKYLLFLDLDSTDLPALKVALKGRPGWLFATGDGFHFVGKDLLPSHAQWERRFKQAARSKVLKAHVDARHVKYSLRRGYATLRMTDAPIKPLSPFLCWDNT